MNVDARGVSRGSCTCTACTCRGYDGGAAKKKCVSCGHPPGKHQNTALNQQEGLNAEYIAHPTNTQVQPLGTVYAHGHEVGTGGDYYPGHQTYYCPQSLPNCKAQGCVQPVYFEQGLPPDLGGFEYCSPECRDRHLLPILRLQLKQDIEDLLVVTRSVNTVSHQPPSSSLKESPKIHPNNRPLERSKKPETAAAKGLGKQPLISSPPKLEKSSSTKSSRTGQNTVQVFIRKDKDEDTGIVVSDEIHTSNETMGFVITGVAVGSKAYKCFQDDQLRLLDIIQSVNENPVIHGANTTVTVQDLFDNIVRASGTVTLLVNRSIALPPVSKQLKDATKKIGGFATHVIAMRSPDCYGQSKFGLSFADKLIEVQIVECEENSSAHYSGLKHGDSIRMSVLASQREIEKHYQTIAVSHPQSSNYRELLSRTLTRAGQEKKAVILFVLRNNTQPTITRL